MKLLHDHITMPEELVFDREVSFTAKGVYAYLLIRPRLEDATALGIAMTMREHEDVVNSALRELEAKGYISDSDAGHVIADAPKPPAKVDKRDPNITELVEYFEHAMGLKMPRMQYQRRAAKTLLAQKEIAIVKRSIDAAVACRYMPYAPRILSLEDLRDKWNGLVDFYRRNSQALQSLEAASARIEKMTGVKR